MDTKKRLTNKRMGIIANKKEVKVNNDPHALELNARLKNITAKGKAFGRKPKPSTIVATEAVQLRFEEDTPDGMAGFIALEKAMLFTSTFHRVGLSYRSVHIIMMVLGPLPMSITDTAELLGLTYYAVRHDLTKLEKMKILNITTTTTRIPTGKGEGWMLKKQTAITLTRKGKKIMAALKKFSTEEFGEYERLMKMPKVQVDPAIRVRQFRISIEEANQLPMDV